MIKKIKQHDITDCGAACIASVSAHYKLQIPIARIRQIASTNKEGTNALGMVQAAEKLGFEAKAVRGVKDSLTKIPLPSIAHVIVNGKLHHFVVISSCKNGLVEYMDPADGLMHTMGIVKFCEGFWTGVLILMLPDDNFQELDFTVSKYKRFWFLLKPHKSILVQTLVGSIVITILGLSTSIYIQKITDYVLPQSNQNLLNLLSVAMLIIILISLVLSVLKSVFMIKTGQQIDARLILGYYKHLLRLPQSFFDSMRVGEINSRIGDAVKIRTFINDVAVDLLVNVFVVIFAFILMFSYYWKLALIIITVIPLYYIVYRITDSLNKKVERKTMENAAELEAQLVESISSVGTIKRFGIEEFANIKTEAKFVGLLKTIYQSSLNSIFTGNASDILSKLFTIILLWAGSYYALENKITAGELLSFYALIGYFTSPVASLIGANKQWQNAIIAADRLFEIMDLKKEEESNETKISLDKGKIGDIQFKEVTFSYGSRAEVFENFNLTIPQAKMTAIVGESGCGKTTLASLIQNIYPLNSGKICINDFDIKYISNESMIEMISTVPQKLDLFSGNVIENIAVGEFSPDMEKIVTICKQIGILDFIDSLPNQFQTYIGENGSQLSGGQKQRIAIARALYKNPEILILDEATSSLDTESEKLIQNTIEQLKQQNKTILVIAHRLSTIKNADNIVVLDKGKIREQGTHTELLANNQLYAKLYTSTN